jgi:hypothetical protein
MTLSLHRIQDMPYLGEALPFNEFEAALTTKFQSKFGGAAKPRICSLDCQPGGRAAATGRFFDEA